MFAPFRFITIDWLIFTATSTRLELCYEERLNNHVYCAYMWYLELRVPQHTSFPSYELSLGRFFFLALCWELNFDVPASFRYSYINKFNKKFKFLNLLRQRNISFIKKINIKTFAAHNSLHSILLCFFLYKTLLFFL